MTESNYTKPLPAPTSDSLPYWEGCRHGQLVMQKCGQCGRFRFYPRATCPYCHDDTVEWQPVRGKGIVYATTVVHRAPSSAFAKDAPYVVAIIELEEGVRMMSNVHGCPPESVVIGMPVEVFFDTVTPEVTLPKFRPLLNHPLPSLGESKK